MADHATNQNQKLVSDSSLQRYAKQIQFPDFGIEAQRNLSGGCALIIGCGALGSVSANLLARAGVGKVVLIDRDFVELSNLQRQSLYEESDIGQPKSIVAAARLRLANSQISIDAKVLDLTYRNIESLLVDHEGGNLVVIDGTDNFETRFLINDACVKHGVPWMYGGCLGAEGQAMTIIPRDTPCLHCLMLDGPPPPGTTETCDTAGIMSSIINVIASIQSNEALKILSGRSRFISRGLQVVDLWTNRFHTMNVSQLRDKIDCPCCHRDEFSWLAGRHGSQSIVLCGRDAVQVSFPDRPAVDLQAVAKKIANLGEVQVNEYLLRLKVEGYVLTLFADGRAIINGTEEESIAKKLYAQYFGA